MDQNGILYIGTALNSNRLYALYTNNGTIKWGYYTGNLIDSSPAIGLDGTIYFGDWNGWVHALNPNGTVKWKYHTGDIITASPAIGPDGTIYIGSHDRNLYAFNPQNGTVKWTFHTGDWVRVSPCVGDDGTIYIVSFDYYLYAINPNGTMKWRFNVGAGTNPTIGPDGTIYAGWNILYAINPDGTEKWSLPLSGGMEGSTPCTSHEGIIYFGTTSDKVYAINQDGTIRWQNNFTWSQSPAAISTDGTLYIGGSSYLRAFGPAPFHIDANGPYTGTVNWTHIGFTSTVLGGRWPYTYHWDFGDNTTSPEQYPSHMYIRAGTYNVTLTVTDSDGNQIMDNTTATITYPDPQIGFVRPKPGIYFRDKQILELPNYVIIYIIGKITIEAGIFSYLPITRVDFYIDGATKATFTSPPYLWTWDTPSFKWHQISIRAWDSLGRTTYCRVEVLKLF